MIVTIIVVMIMILIRMCIMNTYNDYENDASQKRIPFTSPNRCFELSEDRPPYLSMDFQWSFPRKATKHRRIMATKRGRGWHVAASAQTSWLAPRPPSGLRVPNWWSGRAFTTRFPRRMWSWSHPIYGYHPQFFFKN